MSDYLANLAARALGRGLVLPRAGSIYEPPPGPALAVSIGRDAAEWRHVREAAPAGRRASSPEPGPTTAAGGPPRANLRSPTSGVEEPRLPESRHQEEAAAPPTMADRLEAEADEIAPAVPRSEPAAEAPPRTELVPTAEVANRPVVEPIPGARRPQTLALHSDPRSPRPRARTAQPITIDSAPLDPPPALAETDAGERPVGRAARASARSEPRSRLAGALPNETPAPVLAITARHAFRPPPEPPAEVVVRIGRIEVRAPETRVERPRPRREPLPRMSLAEYLARRPGARP